MADLRLSDRMGLYHAYGRLRGVRNRPHGAEVNDVHSDGRWSSIDFPDLDRGVVRHLHLTSRAFLPMCSMPEITLTRGRGVEGDRYSLALEAGFYSHKPEAGQQLTLFEIETLWALRRDHDIGLALEEHRRNVTVEGVPLTHLVGRRFWLGETLLAATRLSTPSRHIEEITGRRSSNLSSTASGNSRSWSRSDPTISVMRDSNVANAAKESAQAEFPHGLLDFCTSLSTAL